MSRPGSNAELAALLIVAVLVTVAYGLLFTSWWVSIAGTLLTLAIFVPVMIGRRRYHR